MNRRQRAAAAAALDPMTRIWLLMGTVAATLLLVVFAAWGATYVYSTTVPLGRLLAAILAVVPVVAGFAAAGVAARAAFSVGRRDMPSLELVGWLWFDVTLLALFAVALVPVGFDVVLVPILGGLPLVLGLLRLRLERRVER